mgnify:CR=1 FL=1
MRHASMLWGNVKLTMRSLGLMKTSRMIYDEHTEGEWEVTGTCVNPEYDEEMYSGDVSCAVLDIEDTAEVIFTAGETEGFHKHSMLSGYIYTFDDATGIISAGFYLDDELVSGIVQIATEKNAWKQFEIYLEDFSPKSNDFNQLKISYSGLAHDGFLLDYIKLEKSIASPAMVFNPAKDGREVELRESDNWLEWRYVDEENWTQLYVIPGGTATDELVKYDEGDPTAGYLSEKIIAGENISIDEGTEENENKLVISSTGCGAGLSEISFEFCVQAGEAQTFDIDIYVTSGYTISKAILESDGTLEGVSIDIDSTPVDGLDDMEVSTVDVFSATNNNVAGIGKRVTINTPGVDSDTPTVIRGKIVLA